MNRETAPEITMALPPTALQLQKVLSWLDVADPRAAALHLATPTHVIHSVAINRSDEGTKWRGVFVPAGIGLIGATEEAATLALKAHRSSDRYLNLSLNEKGSLCKPLPSGGQKILFGVSVLFDGPVFNANPDVSDADLRTSLNWWLDSKAKGDEPEQEGGMAAILDCPDGNVLLWEKGKVVRVENYMRT